MAEIIEGDFRFTFPDIWVNKLDDSTFYREKMKLVSNQKKAVEAVFNPGNSLCFLEVKDYRTDLAGLKTDLKDRLPKEVAQKWQNSISALILGGRTEIVGVQFDESEILTPNIPMQYYLFLESPPTTPGGAATAIKLRTQNELSSKIENLGLKLNSYLKPFKCPVFVCSRQYPAPNQPFTVTLI